MNDSESVFENKDIVNSRNISKSRNSSKSSKIRNMVYIAMMTAVMSLLAQVSFQLPTGVPITLQTFAVALIAAITGWKLGAASTALYVLIGTIGVPVFAGAQAGPGVVAGPAGGFLWGFIIMAALCGIGSSMCTGSKKKADDEAGSKNAGSKNAGRAGRYILGYVLGLVGLVICHICGMIQFMFVADKSFVQSFILVSVPYLAKDIVSVILAYMIGIVIHKRLKMAGLI